MTNISEICCSNGPATNVCGLTGCTIALCIVNIILNFVCTHSWTFAPNFLSHQVANLEHQSSPSKFVNLSMVEKHLWLHESVHHPTLAL